MNANKLADEFVHSNPWKAVEVAANMLRQQQLRINQLLETQTYLYKTHDTDKAEIEKLRQVLHSIANEYVELSHDKIKWQCEDHIKWAKEALK
jgi:ElaB/YqjD/DUF883 family membrane-anchored ribosome-binding protein